jgi:hypothetical protein
VAPVAAHTGTDPVGLLVPSVRHLLQPVFGTAEQPLSGVVATLTGGLRTTLAPVAGGLDHGPLPAVHDTGAVAAGRVLPVASAVPVRTTQAPHTTPARSRTAASAPAVRATRPTTAGSGTRQVPGHPEPAPLPAYPGSDITGTPTTASGSHLGGGAFVTVPTPVAGGQQADPRGPCATEVAIRPLLAEVPTFSPD